MLLTDRAIAGTSCICLQDKYDNIIKNCLEQKRRMENIPRVFCMDKDDILQEHNNMKGWTKLPSTHSACHPCDDSTVNRGHSNGSIRGNEDDAEETEHKTVTENNEKTASEPKELEKDKKIKTSDEKKEPDSTEEKPVPTEE